jgi:hypothetical protein
LADVWSDEEWWFRTQENHRNDPQGMLLLSSHCFDFEDRYVTSSRVVFCKSLS